MPRRIAGNVNAATIPDTAALEWVMLNATKIKMKFIMLIPIRAKISASHKKRNGLTARERKRWLFIDLQSSNPKLRIPNYKPITNLNDQNFSNFGLRICLEPACRQAGLVLSICNFSSLCAFAIVACSGVDADFVVVVYK